MRWISRQNRNYWFWFFVSTWFQILGAVLSTWISCPLPAAFSGSPTWGSSPGISCRRSFGSQGSMKACRKHITIKQVFLGRIRSGFEGENRTWEVRFLWTALDRAYHKIARFFRKWYFRFCEILNESTTIFRKRFFLQEICLFSVC